MKKEDLIKLGLDEETATKIAEASAEELKGFIPKARFDEVNTAKNEADKLAKEYQAEVQKLTKNAKTQEELTEQIASLKAEYEKKEQALQTQLKEQSTNAAVKLALTGKVHDVDIVSGLIDKSKLKIDNGNVTDGLDDQLKTLKESKSFLFVPDKQEPKSGPFGFKVGSNPPKGEPPKKTEPDNLYDSVSSYYQEQN